MQNVRIPVLFCQFLCTQNMDVSCQMAKDPWFPTQQIQTVPSTKRLQNSLVFGASNHWDSTRISHVTASEDLCSSCRSSCQATQIESSWPNKKGDLLDDPKNSQPPGEHSQLEPQRFLLDLWFFVPLPFVGLLLTVFVGSGWGTCTLVRTKVS